MIGNIGKTSSIAALVILLLFPCFTYSGCSGANNPLTPYCKGEVQTSGAQLPATWTWDLGLYSVSEDHTTIKRLPWRDYDYHLNVNRFVEPPNCSDCLKIGPVNIEPDGTLKVKVTLRHPFPNSPQYTGFDVRGTVMFPATRYWKKEPPWIMDADGNQIFNIFVPLYFSRAEDGGAQLLNADGYSMYFFPGFNIPAFQAPIFKYNKGKQAYGPDPDSTINGYKVFTNDPDRHMFLVNDVITRTYHISPPDGEFTFGYVVDACWAQPNTIPVTDPKNDFPFWANCEDGYVLEFEQINPFKTGEYGPPDYPHHPPPLDDRHITTATIRTFHNANENTMPPYLEMYILCPDLTSDPYLQTHGVAYSQQFDVVDLDQQIWKGYQGIYKGTYNAEPGEYVALLYVDWHLFLVGWYKDENEWPIMLREPVFFDFITLEVIAGDG